MNIHVSHIVLPVLLRESFLTTEMISIGQVLQGALPGVAQPTRGCLIFPSLFVFEHWTVLKLICFDLIEFPEVVAFRKENVKIHSLTIHVDQINCTPLVLKSAIWLQITCFQHRIFVLQTPTWCVRQRNF